MRHIKSDWSGKEGLGGVFAAYIGEHGTVEKAQEDCKLKKKVGKGRSRQTNR